MRACIFVALLFGIFVLMFLLNRHTPLQMDDYDYRISWSTGEPVDGFMDVLASQAVHYRLWGGRTVVHALAQLFLWWGKPVFDAANAAMYVLFLLELYAIAKPRGRRFCWSILLAAHAALFLCVPFFGTAFLWLTGACNYLWGTAIALLPLWLVRGGRRRFLAIPLGLLAGWTNENTACAVFLLVLLILVGMHIRGEKPGVWRWGMLAAQGVGILLMLLAPGNFTRASDYETGIGRMVLRVPVAAVYGVLYAGIFAIAAVLLLALLRALGLPSRQGSAMLLMLGAALASLALAVSPVISDRSYTGVIALALASALTLLGDVTVGGVFDAARMAVLPLAVILLAHSGYSALGDVCAQEDAWNVQIERVESAAAAGEEEVTIQSVLSHSRFTMDIRLSDDPDEWPNFSMEKAFGVSIRGE